MGRGKALQHARDQEGFNRRALKDAITANSMGQETPWGSLSYTGEPGTMGFKRHIKLNPQDQAMLDMHRGGQTEIYNALAGKDFGSGKPPGQNSAMPPAAPEGQTPPTVPPQQPPGM